MDLNTKHRIKLTVTDILSTADIDSLTEKDIRTLASRSLNLDLSPLPFKILVRQIVESFLLSLDSPLPSPPVNSEEKSPENAADVAKERIMEVSVEKVAKSPPDVTGEQGIEAVVENPTKSPRNTPEISEPRIGVEKLPLCAADNAAERRTKPVVEKAVKSSPETVEETAERKIEEAVNEVVKSGDLSTITMKDALAIVEEKVGVEVSILPYETVASSVIRCFCKVSDGGVDDTKPKIEVAITEILKSEEMMCSLAIKDVLIVLGEKFGLNFSVLPHRSEPPSTVGGSAEVAMEQVAEIKPAVAPYVYRTICKLSNKREVAISGSGQNTRVSIRELIWKDGRLIASPKSITLSSEQWSVFRKSIPSVEEAIAKVESRLRSNLEEIPAGDMHERFSLDVRQNCAAPSRAEVIHKESALHRPVVTSTGKRSDIASSVITTPRRLIPIQIIRFDGKNYLQWADRMQTYLNHLQVANVLSDPRPSAVGVADGELRQTLSAIEKWTDHDHVCRQNILNSLCDNLFDRYSNKPGSAKDLWEELRFIYLNEEHGAKVSLVRKYIEFQIVEERSVSEQVQEFHQIADSINASGMYVEEKFHVNAILSKLPPTWKPFVIQLMKEDFLPVWMLMNHIKAEEESRRTGNKSDTLLPRPDGPPFQSGRRIGPQRVPMKRPGVGHTNHERDGERKLVRFCTHCNKKGHVFEQCWYQKGKDTNNENGKVGPVNMASEANVDEHVK